MQVLANGLENKLCKDLEQLKKIQVPLLGPSCPRPTHEDHSGSGHITGVIHKSTHTHKKGLWALSISQ